jgi:peptidoglycan/LPS O-acetylase OafA/YrhL
MTGLTAPAPMPLTAPPKETSGAATVGRVQSIDGLRGVAALLVVLFHLHLAVSRTATEWLWLPIDWIARNGAKGVDIFFVISGFVIAMSVSKGAGTVGYFGRFVLRRSIRLDPPYWAAILLEIVLLFSSLRLFPELPVVLPTGGQLFSHFFYLQDLLGYGSIVLSFWTLCYEIQFYGFFVGLVVLRHYLPAVLQSTRWTALFAGGLFLLSLWVRFVSPGSAPDGLFIDRWYQFFIGTLTYFAISEPGRLKMLYLALAALGVVVVSTSASLMHLLPIGVSAWLVLAARDLRWGRLLSSRPLQFLGAISYSLYLFHGSVGWRFVSLMQKLIPGTWSSPMAVAVYLAGIGVSVVFSAVMWRLVERPFLRLSQKIRMPMRGAQSASSSPIPEVVPARS